MILSRGLTTRGACWLGFAQCTFNLLLALPLSLPVISHPRWPLPAAAIQTLGMHVLSFLQLPGAQ